MARALLLAPSRGLGGGIERYVDTLEWAFAAQGVEHERVDLEHPGMSGHAGMLVQARACLRGSEGLTRVVAAHRALLPVAAALSRARSVCGVSVICHGSDVWGAGFRPRWRAEKYLMCRPAVRVVAVSSFTSGVLAGSTPATILAPGLSQEWFGALVRAGDAAAQDKPGDDRAVGKGPEVRLVTAFRLADWRDKGMPELLAAIDALDRPDVRLTVCGSGAAPPELLNELRSRPYCLLREQLTDQDLARELAMADLFVLATRTRPGRRPSGEGFGLVLLEAQVAGTPVMAPAYGGSHDAYLPRVTGVAPTDETPQALAKALEDVLADRVRLAEMGLRARQWAREAFAPERYAPLAVARLL